MGKSLSSLRPVTALILALLLAGCGGGDPEPVPTNAQRAQPVEVTEVQRQTLADTLQVVGSLAANESADIRAEAQSIIRRIHFLEGQDVDEGDLLVQLDERELQAQMREASVRLELARQTLARSDSLLETRSISESDRDLALAETERVKAEVDLLNVRLSKTAVRAPFAGVMGDRQASPGDLVGPSDVLSTINDLSRLKVEFNLPELHAGLVRPGSEFRIISRNSSGDTTGTAYFVSPVVERDTRAITVRGIVEDPPDFLIPGMFVQVEIVLRTSEQVLTVPETAILPREGRRFVVVVEQNDEGQTVAGLRPVVLGLRQRGRVEVTPQGEAVLTEGQQVVAAGVGALPLFPGAPVDPRPMKSLVRGGTAR